MIDKNKQYRTRDGREVRIYAVDGGGEYSVHGAVRNPDGWKGLQFRSDGSVYDYETPSDLIEVKPRIKREVWVNVFRHDGHMADEFLEMHDSKAKADMNIGDARIACVKLTIDCEEGEGL